MLSSIWPSFISRLRVTDVGSVTIYKPRRVGRPKNYCGFSFLAMGVVDMKLE